MKTRRQPTAEQKQKAAERRERFTALAKQVAAMSEDERTALVMKVGAIVTCEGRALSGSQLVPCSDPACRRASMVGGFWQWQDKGRRVKKGEHGLMIWIPTARGEKAEDGAHRRRGRGRRGEGEALRVHHGHRLRRDPDRARPRRPGTLPPRRRGLRRSGQ